MKGRRRGATVQRYGVQFHRAREILVGLIDNRGRVRTDHQRIRRLRGSEGRIETDPRSRHVDLRAVHLANVNAVLVREVGDTSSVGADRDRTHAVTAVSRVQPDRRPPGERNGEQVQDLRGQVVPRIDHRAAIGTDRSQTDRTQGVAELHLGPRCSGGQ